MADGGQEAAPPSRRSRAAAITASASAITASATATLASVGASAASRRAASPRASALMTINSTAQATTATTAPATAVTMNAKEKLNTISRLFIIMDVKSAGTASTLPRIRRRQPRHSRAIGAADQIANYGHIARPVRPQRLRHAPTTVEIIKECCKHCLAGYSTRTNDTAIGDLGGK